MKSGVKGCYLDCLKVVEARTVAPPIVTLISSGWTSHILSWSRCHALMPAAKLAISEPEYALVQLDKNLRRTLGDTG